MPTARSLDVPLCCRPQILSCVEAGFLSDMRITGRPRSSVLPARHPPIQPRTQRCPRLRHALFDRLPTPDRLLGHDVPDARFDLEQNPLQDLLNDRPQATGSRATLQSNPGDLPNCRIGENQIDKAFRIATPMRKASWTKRFAEGWGERRGANADGGSGGEGWREWAGGVSEKSLPMCAALDRSSRPISDVSRTPVSS